MEVCLDAKDLFGRHRALLDDAVRACRTRANWSAFNDDPTKHPGGRAGLAGVEAIAQAPQAVTRVRIVQSHRPIEPDRRTYP